MHTRARTQGRPNPNPNRQGGGASRLVMPRYRMLTLPGGEANAIEKGGHIVCVLKSSLMDDTVGRMHRNFSGT